jgi:hypothetical protein
VLAGTTPVLVHNCPNDESGDTFRVDTRGPDTVFENRAGPDTTIFESGLEPRGDNMSLEEHVSGLAGTYTPDSGYVATVTSHNYAATRAGVPSIYIKFATARKGIDVNQEIPGNVMGHEGEITVLENIPTECIVGCHMPDGTFVDNPNFGGSGG